MTPFRSKIKTREEVCKLRHAVGNNVKVAFTSGVFDILHPGHVQYLEQAKSHCDVLIVGINSDSSVKEIKGPFRPINKEYDRAQVISGLASVDYVFIFGESNNNKNVELLKPDVYVKADQYKKSKLTSASLVESYGGKVILAKLAHGYSSTQTIEKIIEDGALVQSISNAPAERRPAIFVDRDGTINEHIDYLHEIEKFKLIPGVLEELKRLRENGYRIVVVTNQPGIGLGYFTKEDFFKVTRELMKAASKIGLAFDKIYFCPHNQSEECVCRKPKTGLIERAVKELNIDLKASIVIGDTTSDIMLGKTSGCKTILVKTGLRGEDGMYNVQADLAVNSVSEATQWILKLGKGEL